MGPEAVEDAQMFRMECQNAFVSGEGEVIPVNSRKIHNFSDVELHWIQFRRICRMHPNARKLWKVLVMQNFQYTWPACATPTILEVQHQSALQGTTVDDRKCCLLHLEDLDLPDHWISIGFPLSSL